MASMIAWLSRSNKSGDTVTVSAQFTLPNLQVAQKANKNDEPPNTTIINKLVLLNNKNEYLADL